MSPLAMGRGTRVPGRLIPSYYYWSGDAAVSTNGSLGFGTLRVRRYPAMHAFSMNRLGAEIATAGGAGTTMRIGIYSDLNGIPDQLLLEAPSALDGTSATMQEFTVALSLLTVPWWGGGVLQGSGTQPTPRCVGAPDPDASFPASIGGTQPAANTSPQGCYTMTGVTAALPQTFVVGGIGGVAPRLHFKVASVP